MLDWTIWGASATVPSERSLGTSAGVHEGPRTSHPQNPGMTAADHGTSHNVLLQDSESQKLH